MKSILDWRVCALVAGTLVPGGAAAKSGLERAGDWLTTLADTRAWRDQGHWRVAVSPYTMHFRPSEEHQPVRAVALERQRHDGWLAGISHFSNSFGQPSALVYLGRRLDLLRGSDALFAQLSGGLMYGYRGRFEDKVPLNNNGFSPGGLVSLGWQVTPRKSAIAHLVGDGGVMLQLSWDFR